MTPGSYSVDPCRKSIVLSRTRLCSESGVVDAIYDRNDDSVRPEAYEDAAYANISSGES